MEQYALTAILLLGFFVLLFSGVWMDREPQAERPAFATDIDGDESQGRSVSRAA